MDNRRYSLYQITFPNGKCYFGISCDVKHRWAEHKRMAHKGYSDLPVYRAIREYGWDAIVKEILVVGNQVYIKTLETKAIKAFSTLAPDGYNMHRGGNGCHTPETLKTIGEKVKITALRTWQDPIIRERRLLAGNTPECRKAKGAHKLGKKESDETRARKSVSMRGVIKSPEHAAKCRANNIGRIYVTNGVNNRMLKAQDEIPQGWYRGKTDKKNKR